jgi:prepilin-type N-terminal cleavage/methylation domain-containing protein
MDAVQRRVRPGRWGFTMIELMTTIVIIGALVAITLPRVDLERFQVDTAAQAIGTSLLTAQREAVSRQHNVLVVFDTVTSTIRTVWDANNNEIADGTEKSRAFQLPERVKFARPSGIPARPSAPDRMSTMAQLAGKPMLVFQRSGSADRAAYLYVTTSRALIYPSMAKSTRFIEIARATGRPNWWRYTGTAWERSF